jgi:hypothetical protein
LEGSLRAGDADAMKTTISQLNVRRADERGYANHFWLDTHHTFSFANYHDLTGKPPRTFQEFASEDAAAFQTKI